MTDTSHTEDLLNGPGLEEPAVRKDLIPEWMKKLFWVLVAYKAYSIARSITYYLAVSNTPEAVDHMGRWVAFLTLDLLEMLVYLGLLGQWKPAAATGIVVLSVSVLTVLGYFASFLVSYNKIRFSMPGALLLEVVVTLVSSGLLILILIRLFRIRRAWENGVPGK
ncbi:hypothetical protein ACFOTA_06385 [Chitinophaga sp. GCM10012297]|uniref:Uncharacterized protein n=1 Tax=Chitinophaga chungangae TaxID=2821488 RepID=A0ABS3YAX1_9BACT|nr:hypothetical protein [Chitinophaga chungangae]MBO9151827.1 hypothetical protein [Chitinophaga chungangae]